MLKNCLTLRHNRCIMREYTFELSIVNLPCVCFIAHISSCDAPEIVQLFRKEAANLSKTVFSQLDLTPEVYSAIQGMGFETATEIQWKAIPFIKSGNDVIGKSQTGTGKTLAFGIPAVEMIEESASTKPGMAQVLVLCPTRELAVQATEEIKKLAKFKPFVRTAAVYGGASIDGQIASLKRANVVIGTPGRVMDHLRRRTLKLNELKLVVLDEADEMLSMGFRDDIETILKDSPSTRQTVLFSATMSREIMDITKRFQKSPQVVEVNRQQATVDSIEQCYYSVPSTRKMDALNILLKYYQPRLCMLFCNTKKMVDDVTDYLKVNGFSANGIHGDMKQMQRIKVLGDFKSSRVPILVATDVAARGIDVNDIDFVINYDIPQNVEYYIHRIGRTGRAGKSGKAITLCCGFSQSGTLQGYSRTAKCRIVQETLPSINDVIKKQQQLWVERVSQHIDSTASQAFEPMVQDLIVAGYSPEVIASVALEMLMGKELVNFAEIQPTKPFRSQSPRDNARPYRSTDRTKPYKAGRKPAPTSRKICLEKIV